MKLEDQARELRAQLDAARKHAAKVGREYAPAIKAAEKAHEAAVKECMKLETARTKREGEVAEEAGWGLAEGIATLAKWAGFTAEDVHEQRHSVQGHNLVREAYDEIRRRLVVVDDECQRLEKLLMEARRRSRELNVAEWEAEEPVRDAVNEARHIEHQLEVVEEKIAKGSERAKKGVDRKESALVAARRKLRAELHTFPWPPSKAGG